MKPIPKDQIWACIKCLSERGYRNNIDIKVGYRICRCDYCDKSRLCLDRDELIQPVENIP